MEVFQQILLWIFGILTIVFLLQAILSLFMDGISSYGVSDRANKKSHFYGLLAAISSVVWLIVLMPNEIETVLFCALPVLTLTVGISYGSNILNRKFAKWLINKINDHHSKENE